MTSAFYWGKESEKIKKNPNPNPNPNSNWKFNLNKRSISLQYSGHGLVLRDRKYFYCVKLHPTEIKEQPGDM